ncbi:hypothetical protein HN51_031001 [Arachis hypogaea]|uniref:Uncharacterized protein n=1 Tax=Arachis hypogaea TaxID=3818 RepID=A0A445B8X3_ARAHY|nr:inactive TPR repeat-containing thioredoxin TTL3 [Arachis hypogaea]QHO15576.1 Inactive TPR repeat-containing thioredoxin [Arachis hypogaea]RYR35127.1 hypothetical protein Ahy_A10g050263 [Arachis hypogaea]
MRDTSPESRGCGLLSSLLRRRGSSRSKTERYSGNDDAHNHGKQPSKAKDSKRPRSDVSDDARRSASSASSNSNTPQRQKHVVVSVNQNHQRKQQQHDEAAAASMAVCSSSRSSKVSPVQGYVNQGRKVPKDAVGISGELDSMLNDYQKPKGSNKLVRASSNVMIYGNLGNLGQGGGGTNYPSSNIPMDKVENGGGSNNNRNKKVTRNSKEESGSLCRAVSTRMDPEQLKIMGNEDYKNGNFAEALALYDAAIAIDPNKAAYRSNKSAALTALGRLLEAVFECREAIRIDQHYQRAHQRLGNLYFRLGDPEKALYHYKQAGPEADPDEIAKVKILQVHLNKCTEARRVGDCNTLITETNKVISSGADSAQQIFALQAEALLKLRRHQDAEKIMSKCPKFDVDECTRFFGPICNANLLVTHAQVDIAAGRFEDALEAAQKAVSLDPNNREANMVMRKARDVSAARSKGNELFKASRFSEACAAYGEGLERDPYNSVLLCNSAACRSKLGQYEKAAEDCTLALNLRPSYAKARLRRADCNAKLERWEASIQDYEILLKETPDDEQVKRALLEAQEKLKTQRGG